jgi:hypothetical protein
MILKCIDSDYRRELETCHRETLDLWRRDRVHGKFGVLIRAEGYERYKAALKAGRLRREHLTLFFSRVFDTKKRVEICRDRSVTPPRGKEAWRWQTSRLAL